jgi:hypothetical protein
MYIEDSLHLFQTSLLEHRSSNFPSFIVPITPIGTSLKHFFNFHCSNHPYWNIAQAFFQLSLFQSPLLEHRSSIFSTFIVPIIPIGTSLKLYFNFHCSNHPYWNIAQALFPLSLFQSFFLEHRTSIFLTFIVPIASIGTSHKQLLNFHCFQSRPITAQRNFIQFYLPLISNCTMNISNIL